MHKTQENTIQRFNNVCMIKKTKALNSEHYAYCLKSVQSVSQDLIHL
jgi:hypothetical protein